MKEGRVIPVSIKDTQNKLNLKPWADGVNQHPDTMLPVTQESLGESFKSRLAVVLIDSQSKEVLGGTRFTPLLDNTMKEELGLDEHFPQIWELGSIFVGPRIRGNGFNLELNKALLDSSKEKIDAGELLVIGTTKTLLLIKTLLRKDIGFNFSMASHDEYPMIAPLTCVCKGEMGQGFQESSVCSSRIKPNQVSDLQNVAEKDGKIPCTLFVSDRQLAQRIDEGLRSRFSRDNLLNPQQAEVELLKGIGHYK